MTAAVRTRRARVATTAGVVVFWVGTAVAGMLEPGYSARDDVVSRLAARGSEVAALGIAAILASALAHGAAALVVRRVSRLGAALLLGAAIATAVIAGFRISGDGGADSGGDLLDTVHYLGVVSYEVLIVAAMAVVATRALGGRGWPRGLVAVSVLAVALSVALLVRSTGTDPGLWQRLWVATNLGWLLLATWTVRPQPTGDSGWTATSPAR